MVKTKKKSVKFDLPRTTTVSAMDEEVESDEDDLSDNENIISASEDEDASSDERKHTKLLEAISALGGKKRKKMTERSEASLQVSEFTVNTEGAGEKVALSDLLSSTTEASRTAEALTKTHKQLKKLEKSQATLELPLTQQQADKIQREAAFDKASKEVSRWESTILHQQRAEQLVFPLNLQSSRPKRVEHLVTNWKAQTPLEQEVFAVLHAHRQPTFDPVLTPVEEAQLQAMSLEEAQMRRAELQKARALQSYYEAKAKRERKIKSKKYHKVQQKSKRKAFVQQFEELCKSDPERALEELQKMEKNRIEERMSLKHQNSGKWAKSKAIMAKYDLGARQAMQEQLELNRQLTHKPLPSSVLHDDSDHDDDPNTDPALASGDQTLPDIVNDASANQKEGANPWMKMAVVMATAEQEEEEKGNDAKPDGETPETARSGGEDAGRVGEEGDEETEEDRLLREFADRRRLRKANEEEQEDEEGRQSAEAQQAAESPTVRAEVSEDDDGGGGGEEDDAEDEEDQMDEAAATELNALFGRLAKQSQRDAAPLATAEPVSEATLLDEDTVRVRTLEDVELLADAHTDSAPVVESEAAAGGDVDDPAPKRKGRKQIIDLQQVLTKEAKSICVPMATPAVEDAEDEALDEQTEVIREAFAGDDVVSDFLKEKRKQEKEGRPKDVDLSLPGWGEWGGVGIQIRKQKRRRFLKKAPPPAPRKDQKLPAVIISEKRDASLAAHQVNQLPFPFENPDQFERNIRSPLGSTWNPELAVRKLTAPRIVTKAGAIIEPMSRDDIKPRKPSAAKRGAPDIHLGSGEQRGGHHRPGAKKKKHKK